ncbi:hypothetical protein [Terriglobus sp.]|uniref:hypothetical protein n=1 Tax=Terriglobus sp. TaxID=1889013 RepID=UPI003B006B86
MRAVEKRLNEMDRLGDMLHFPAAVNAGATMNVLITVLATWFVEPRYPLLAAAWVALVLLLNLLPVVLLRLQIGPATVYPTLPDMDFVRDQHKFSDWVYVAASANMAFWVLLTWTLSAVHRTGFALAALEAMAFLVTFSPVLLRRSGSTRN